MASNASDKTDPGFFSGLVAAAYTRIKAHVIPTRLVRDDKYNLWLKCENEQETGSFKWRGALAKLSLFKPGQHIITASTGNHGLGVASASLLYGLKAKIFIPVSASAKKVEKLIALGADLQRVDGDSLDAEKAGKEFARAQGLPWVSPYNDPDVISGQGTIGLEITEALPELDKIYITVGGGGLISGIGSWIRTYHPGVEIIACQPIHSPEMYLSIMAGHVVNAPESLTTLSDGSAGPLEEDSITFGLCDELVDRFLLVSEDEIEKAIKHLFHTHELVVEGAAAVAMAAAIKDPLRRATDQSVIILCGGNIDSAIHKKICS